MTFTIDPVSADLINEALPLIQSYLEFYKCNQPREKILAYYLELARDPKRGIQFLAKAGTTPAGFITLYQANSSLSLVKGLELNDLYVAPNFRRTGLATALFQKAQSYATETNQKFLSWRTAPDNVTAQAFYKKLGIQGNSWICYRKALDNMT